MNGITTIGGEFLVNSYTTSDQSSSKITALIDGSYVIVWRSYLQDGAEGGIYAQRYSASKLLPNSWTDSRVV